LKNIVFLQKKLLVLVNQALYLANIDGTHATVSCQRHGQKPELALTIPRFDVDMGRFCTFI
jgi:23S rRNA G2069 N7-methylase RlmK/C1962 C5-methylase RlmI